MNGRCGLCGKEKELQESHIIPSFVFKWLKDSSVTGHFRHGETINKRVQDGAKLYLLCWDCEQLFGKWEDIFAKEVFMPLHQNKPIKQYGTWLLKFSTSVSWRVLTFFKNHLDLNHFPDNLLKSVDNALKIWQEFLLDKRPHPECCEQHLLPFRGFIGERNPALIVSPDEIANAVLALCSGLMDGVTGQVLMIDHGANFANNLMGMFEKHQQRTGIAKEAK